MNIRRAVIAAAGGIAATALVGTLPVSAQEPLLPISVTPGSGPAGTTVTVAGDSCIGEETGPGDLVVFLFDSTSEQPIGVFSGAVGENGDWTFQLTFEATDPPGLYAFSALCFESPESEKVIADYDFATFELTAPAPPEPTPTEPAPAAPAAPVQARPTFTG